MEAGEMHKDGKGVQRAWVGHQRCPLYPQPTPGEVVPVVLFLH